jgi:NADPH-dependent ferric siderophore reductase
METMSANAADARVRRPQVKLWRVPVRRIERITPRMARVTVAGDDLADFPGAGTDQNVMLYFYPDSVRLPEPLTLESARALWSKARPMTRTYTVARHDPDASEIDFDFVLHSAAGAGGLASDWAQRVRPGDPLIFVGPSPAYRPDPDAGTYLLAGDETALPAMAAILRELPARARARVLVEVADVAEEQPLPTAADAEITWLHRDGRPAGRPDLLDDAVRGLDLPAATTEAWVAGERSAVLAVRRYLLDERGLPRHRVRPTTYWRHGQSGN